MTESAQRGVKRVARYFSAAAVAVVRADRYVEKLHSAADSRTASLAGARVSFRIAGRTIAVALIAVAIAAIGSCAIVAFAHIGDDYAITDDAPGVWIALARYANDGTFFPPLFDGHTFGGTRYMPLPVLLLAGVERLTGDYALAGKLISLVLMAALLAITYRLLRREDCPRAIALALVSTLVVTGPGIVNTQSIRNDVLAVILQIVAVAVATSTTRPRVLTATGALCALAMAAKFSAVWAPVAIGVWLLVRNRSALVAFVSGFAVALAALVGFFEAISHGRLSDNFSLMFAGSRGSHSLAWLFHRYTYLLAGLGPVRLLLAIAVAATAVAAWRRRLTVYQIALFAALVVLVPVAKDVGAVVNHALDTHVLVLFVIGGFWPELRTSRMNVGIVQLGFALCVLATSAAAYASGLTVLGLREGAHVLLGGTRPPSLHAKLVRMSGRATGSCPRIRSWPTPSASAP